MQSKSKKVLSITGCLLLIYILYFISAAILFAVVFGYGAFTVVRAWRQQLQYQNATMPQKNHPSKIYVEAIALSVVILCTIPWLMIFCLSFGWGLVVFMMGGYKGFSNSFTSITPFIDTIPHVLMCMGYIGCIVYYLFPVACVFFGLKIMRRNTTSYYYVWLLLPVVITFIWLSAATFVLLRDEVMHHPNSAKAALWLEKKLTAIMPVTHANLMTTTSTVALPAGNYNQSCPYCEVHDAFLICQCFDAAGNHVNSQLDLTKVHLKNTILQNCNGRLMYVDHC